MRRSRVFITGVLALGVAVAVSGIAAAAAGDPVQKIDAVVSPKKLPASDLKPAKLHVTTETFYDSGTGADDPARIPPKASKAVISLPDNLEFDPSVVPQCKTDISTLSSDAAIAACKTSQVSTASTTKNAAVAAVPLGPGQSRVNLDARVVAFNGPKQGGKPSILLHSYIPQLNVTTLLVGVLKNASGKYGNKLDVTIPPLAGGAGAIRMFSVEIKKGAYVQGTCPANDKTLHFAGAFTTDVGVLKATDTVKCTSQR
jgi:hypothetical protein